MPAPRPVDLDALLAELAAGATVEVTPTGARAVPFAVTVRLPAEARGFATVQQAEELVAAGAVRRRRPRVGRTLVRR